MADRVVPGPVDSSACIREAVCIHTKKIYSGCRDKDCIEDLRVFPTVSSRAYIDAAFSIRPGSAELLYTAVNVEEITFNRGYYTVDAQGAKAIIEAARPRCVIPMHVKTKGCGYPIAPVDAFLEAMGVPGLAAAAALDTADDAQGVVLLAPQADAL